VNDRPERAPLGKLCRFHGGIGLGNLIPPNALALQSGSREIAMPDNGPSTGKLGVILGAVIAVAAMVFLLSGGEYFGKKTINSDADLPPVATTKPK
jgi:hypothetical protein